MQKQIKKIVLILMIFAGAAYKWYMNKPMGRGEIEPPSIKLTRHAECRMKCRGIDLGEIEMTLVKGRINHQKSEPDKKPCPIWAREFYSAEDRQNIRVISADCPRKSTIITVIDLGKEHECDCS